MTDNEVEWDDGYRGSCEACFQQLSATGNYFDGMCGEYGPFLCVDCLRHQTNRDTTEWAGWYKEGPFASWTRTRFVDGRLEKEYSRQDPQSSSG